MHHSQHTSEASDSRCVDFTQFGWNSSEIEVTPPLKPCDSGGSLTGTASAEVRTATLGRELQRRRSALLGIWILVMTFGFMSASPRLFAQAKPSPPPLPREPHFYSAQQIQKGVTLPPLPANPFPDLDLYPLGGGDYAYDDRDVDYDLLREQAELEKALTAVLVGAAPLSAPLDFGPDDLGLEIHDATVGVTGWTAELTIHPPSTPAFPYDLFYTPTLDEPISWRFLMRCTSTEVIARWLCQEQGYFMLTKISGNLGVSTATTAQQMAQSLVPSFVTVANATYTGHADARGTFWNGNSCGLPVDSGVILSSGPVSNAYGPNDDDGEDGAVYGYSDMGQPGDSDLEGLVGGGETVDAAVLEFDFSSPTSFDLRVQFLYASEEYPEWIGDYNDPIAIFVNGSVVNVALVPGTSDPIAVHTINGGCVADAGGAPTPATNPAYYVDNYDPYYSALPQYAADDDMFNIQYDGMTILLQAEIPILASVTTHLKIAVADYAGDDDDHWYDSAVFVGSWSPEVCQ